MREIIHRSLTQLVGLNGSHKIDPKYLQILESSSVQPDEIRREQISKGMLEAIKGSIGWVTEHTMKAKELAIENVIKAYEAYNSRDLSWLKFLGWCFHYIADWATPYHSVRLMAKYILDSENDNSNEKSQDTDSGWIKLLNKISNLLKFKVEHDKFEDICEKRWDEIESVVIEKFIKFKNNSSFSVDINKFDNLMDELRLKVDDLSADWANRSTPQDFASYITRIAILMDIACRLVFERG